MPSSREVMDALIRNRPAPRMGFRENIWSATRRKWTREGYPTGPRGEPVDAVEHFDHDWAIIGDLFDLWPIRGCEEVVEETDEWHVIRNGSGAELKHWKHRPGTPEHIRFSMTSREIWEETYRPHLLFPDAERLSAERVGSDLERRRRQGRWTIFSTLFVFEHMRQSLGDVCMYESFALDPAWIRDYTNVVTDFFIAHFRELIEKTGRPDAVRVCEDLGYKGALFCSPQSLEDLVFPCYRKLVEFFHAQDIPVLLHSCGYVEEVLDLIVEAGFDALDPMERAAGCDPVRIAEKTAGRLVLVGGFDKRLLESGDREAIRRGVVELLDEMRSRKVRYVFSTDHSVSTNVSYGDYRYMVDVFREHMYY